MTEVCILKTKQTFATDIPRQQRKHIQKSENLYWLNLAQWYEFELNRKPVWKDLSIWWHK